MQCELTAVRTRKRKMMKTYSELVSYDNFIDRFNYLKLNGRVGEETFGYDRYINQIFYKSDEWKRAKREVKIRDNGCDLGVKDRLIGGPIFVHHLNPITKEDILNRNPDIFNPEYLISVSDMTHRAIHYGDESLLLQEPIERTQNDTTPWK